MIPHSICLEYRPKLFGWGSICYHLTQEPLKQSKNQNVLNIKNKRFFLILLTGLFSTHR